VPADKLVDFLGSARAFVFPGEEDFGIAPVEAQACGVPVIAFGRGGARETVLFVNSSSDTVQAEPVVAGGEALVPSGTLTIGPYGVAVTRRSINPTIRSAPAGVAALAAGERRDAQL